jgi:hypothetical protein
MPETAIAPAPAPAPAPSPSPSPAPAPKPVPAAPQPESNGSINDSLKELQDLYNENAAPDKPAPKPVKNGNGKPEKAKAPEAPETPEEADPDREAEVEVESKATEEQPKPGEAAKPAKRESPWQLVHKREAEIKELRKQLEEKSKPVEDVEKKQLLEYKAKMDERLKQLEEEVEYSSFERSDKYKQQYESPYVDAYIAGRSKTASLKIGDGNGGFRQGTAEDFDSLMRIAANDDDAAADKATELFGAKAPLVLYHIERVKELNAAKHKAVEEYRTKGTERQKQFAEQQQLTQKQQEEQHKALATEFNTAKQAAIEKFEWLRPKEGADKRNELLQKGFDLNDRAFSDGQPLKEGQKPMTPVELSRLRAAMYNKASAFDAVRHEHKEAVAKIAELEEKLKQYEESEPKNGTERGVETPRFGSAMDAAEAGLRKLGTR